ncbi:nuclear transport factor 2 family protein [Pseudolysobacter antarcticus]|uniref:Nuclear transport factor 2 family protein n=2 Tax=Pseudolysobacter antarcticus TaxID=2511995 RepID=A0A411HPS6_9GAMM|nr:nuclear transport factor 2 family protein [Pseudolysobacter antarcticus]
MTAQQPETVRNALIEWHRMIASSDLSALPALLHPDALFRSPMAFKPYRSAQAVAMILGTVITIFKNFVYERQFISGDGMSVTLEFSAMVGDKQLKGVDLIRFDEHGKIVEFEVMIRPINATAALGEEMGKRLGALLPAFKTAP